MSIDLEKEVLKETITSHSPEELMVKMSKFQELMMMYNGAMREVRTKLEVLNDEFQIRNQRNPIEFIKCRLKKPSSIFGKLRRKGFPLSIESITDNIHDVAGVRVICPFIDDIYAVTEMLCQQDDIFLINKEDYIKNPKPNGYRSMHLVVEVPVFFSNKKQNVKVEIQIRTIAMDFWASLEHQIHYKKDLNAPENLILELKDCADIIAETDQRMQELQKQLAQLSEQKK